ncbi:Pyruvate:ferredoxin oxidoreductase, gamma subunit [hydrothermal vent metagenome]|uniref:Pyruvate:ferredoxin oxidoreductase, gamma subunit n=1 Tax=hydrothermal vent metagenome TaxID=652676 RepID=A0A3B0SZ92_9ZZZZ
MFQVRIHGRGGQGVVTAAELLSIAVFHEGKNAQAFPSFGSERMGAPVVSYLRMDDREIRLREPINAPDALIIQDPTLLHSIDIFKGLNRQGYILINSQRTFEDMGLAEYVATFPAGHACVIGATELAMKHVGRPLPNAALLGGFAAISGKIRLDSVEQAIVEKFPGAVGAANAAAARAAFDIARKKTEAITGAQETTPC